MEGQGVDGHVGDTSPKRNAFVRVFENVSLFSLLSLSGLVLSCPVLFLSCLVLSCRVLSCLVVCVCVGVRVCWRAAHSPQFPSGELEYNSFIRYSE